MSRIIAGLAGSIRLAPAPSGTRPSSDRLKESLFSQLENLGAIEGANVLDLFAGTGALGLEALSRGAKSLVGIDSNRAAIQVCLRNAATVGSALNQAGVRPPMEFKVADAFAYVSGTTKEFDLILIDPPYDLAQNRVEALLELVAALLASGGYVALEQSSKADITAPKSLESVDRRVYGDSAVWLFKENAQ